MLASYTWSRNETDVLGVSTAGASGITGISGIDTRALTIALREHGTIAAALAVGADAIARIEADLTRYVREATTEELEHGHVHGAGGHHH